jgi:hypothetical protein
MSTLNKRQLCAHLRDLKTVPSDELIGEVISSLVQNPPYAVQRLDSHGRTLVWMLAQAVSQESVRLHLLPFVLSLPQVNVNGVCDNGYTPLFSLYKRRCPPSTPDSLRVIIDNFSRQLVLKGAVLGSRATRASLVWRQSLLPPVDDTNIL